MADQIKSEGIPFRIISGVDFSTSKEFRGEDYKKEAAEWEYRTKKEIASTNLVFGGGSPVVFINGRAKSNPSLEDVISEYEFE